MKEELAVHMLMPKGPAGMVHMRELLDPNVCLTTGLTIPASPDYHILIASEPKREHIVASPNLNTLIIPVVGMSPETRKLLIEFPQVAVHNLHHNASSAAEMAVGLLLAAAKFIVPADRALRANDWSIRYQANVWMTLEGKTALILGYGAIGRKVAHLCRALGMRIIGLSRRLPGNSPDEVYPAERLHEMLPRAQALILCLPLTEETRGLIDERELALLPAAAILINVARGPIVQEKALYDALWKRSLKGAGIDVWYQYPMDEASRVNTSPSSYPFGELDNVVLTPHLAGGSILGEEEEMRSVRALAELVNSAARGEPMPNRIDIQRGY